jgi:hypothetical protein
MSHEVTPANEHLAFLHSALMKAIDKVINQNSPFKYQEKVSTLGLDCVSVAKEVYHHLLTSHQHLSEMVSGRERNYDTFGAFPLQDDELKKSVAPIYAKLLEQIDNIPATLLTQIVKSSADMNDNNKNNIFSIHPQYSPFQAKEGHLQPVSMGDNKSGEKLFRAHLCKITMKAGSSIHDALQSALLSHYDNLVRADEEIEEKTEMLSEINRQIKNLFDDPDNLAIIGLRQLLDQETSGLIKRELGIAYLEYLLVNAKKQGINCQELERMINNIRWVEDYSYQIRNHNEYCIYQVTDEHACDLRELLGHADTFTNLPVIGLIDGNLEERTGGTERVFVFGIRFKANNPVTTPDKDFPTLKSGMSVYARHLAKAIEVLKLAKQFNTARGEGSTDYSKLRLLGRSIRTVFLYYMVFSEHAEKVTWWQETATMLHHREPQALDRLLKLADTMLKAETKIISNLITPAVNTLKAVLENKTAGCFKGSRKSLILLDKLLVNNDIFEAAEGDIFIKVLQKSGRQEENNLKKCLRYVRIAKDTGNDQPDESAITISRQDFLHSISFEFAFYDTFFYADRQHKRAIRVQTQAQTWQFLPVLVRPQIPKGEERDIYHQPLVKTAGLMVQIMPDIKPDKSNTFEFFVYKVTVAVVFLLGLSALCQKLSVQSNLAIPMVRVHKSDEADPIEEYLKSVCTAVIFLLNEKYTAGMQGIQLIDFKGSQKELGYKITNARSSLYAFLPKTFTAKDFAPAFDKLAIVIVTQRVASKHRHEDDNDSLVNLFGRVVMLERMDELTIQLSSHFLTFTDNLYKRDIHTHPKFLVDTVHHLYDEYGVRNILYIAKAPFTSNLNFTQKDSQKELFFMSETILQDMRQSARDDLNIYPVFYDKYPAKMFGGTKLNAIYIDDVPSIQKHVQMDRDSESQIVTFLNIANGIKVKGKEAEKNFFNNVMSYATLDNIYKDTTLQTRILGQIIDSNTTHRQTLIDFICLLHAAAYEKVEKNELTQLTLKLNPYQDILEDDNVNRLNTFSAFPTSEKPAFNLFAFMTKIQRIISLLDK